MKNPAAVALGKLARSKPKNFSRAERRRRALLASGLADKRWAKHRANAPSPTKTD